MQNQHRTLECFFKNRFLPEGGGGQGGVGAEGSGCDLSKHHLSDILQPVQKASWHDSKIFHIFYLTQCLCRGSMSACGSPAQTYAKSLCTAGLLKEKLRLPLVSPAQSQEHHRSQGQIQETEL